MTSSAIDETPVPVQDVRVTNKMLEVVLRDGRTLSVPLEWYPRLAHGSRTERQRWRLIGEARVRVLLSNGWRRDGDRVTRRSGRRAAHIALVANRSPRAVRLAAERRRVNPTSNDQAGS